MHVCSHDAFNGSITRRLRRNMRKPIVSYSCCTYPCLFWQWLVKKALENQAETMSHTLGHGVFQFNRRQPDLAPRQPAANRSIIRLAEVRGHCSDETTTSTCIRSTSKHFSGESLLSNSTYSHKKTHFDSSECFHSVCSDVNRSGFVLWRGPTDNWPPTRPMERRRSLPQSRPCRSDTATEPSLQVRYCHTAVPAGQILPHSRPCRSDTATEPSLQVRYCHRAVPAGQILPQSRPCRSDTATQPSLQVRYCHTAVPAGQILPQSRPCRSDTATEPSLQVRYCHRAVPAGQILPRDPALSRHHCVGVLLTDADGEWLLYTDTVP